MVECVQPQKTKTIADPACGTGGFLSCSLAHIRENYVKSVEDRAVLVGLRLYGSSVEFFDQTWRPDNVVKIK